MTRNRRVWLTLLIVILIVGLVGGVGWRLMQPTIKLATRAEIDAVLPKDLVVESAPDSGAQERYTHLLALTNKLGEQYSSLDPMPYLFPKGVPGSPPPPIVWKGPDLAKTRKVWMDSLASPSGIAGIEHILDQGPLELARNWKPETRSYLDRLGEMMPFIRLTGLSARAFAKSGDYEMAVRTLQFLLKLNQRLFEANNTTFDYLEEMAFEGIAVSTVRDIVRDPKCPISICREILAALKPASASDPSLANTYRTEFQLYTRRQLADDPIRLYKDLKDANNVDLDPATGDPLPIKHDDEPLLGTYDAIATAKLFAKVVEAHIHDALVPHSRADKSAETFEDRELSSLPDPSELEKLKGMAKWWATFVYRYKMNTGRNTIGRYILMSQGAPGSEKIISCTNGANRNATRVLIASRIYKLTHGGKLPPTIAGFLPILGQWPVDPFNGKPMIYNPSEGKVYSVGQNLIDDGGDFTGFGTMTKDVGLIL